MNELKEAIKDMEVASNNGFKHCLAVFELINAGVMLDDNIAIYYDLIVKAHPTDSSKDFGAGWSIAYENIYKNGNIIEKGEAEQKEASKLWFKRDKEKEKKLKKFTKKT